MLTLIKRPQRGQSLQKRSVRLRVVDIFTYQNLIQGEHIKYVSDLNKTLRHQLGDNFRNLYFEAVCRVEKSRRRNLTEGETIIVDWQEVQDYDIVA